MILHFYITLSGLPKIYRLGGETDSTIWWRKWTGVILARGTEEAGC